MKKSTSIEFKCSDFEREMFARAAQARGMSLSAWVRDALRFMVLHERAKAMQRGDTNG